MGENDLDQFATFMGHSINIHRSFYRLPEDTLQLAKVSKILLAMDSNEMNKYSGLSLDEIEISSSGKLMNVSNNFKFD